MPVGGNQGCLERNQLAGTEPHKASSRPPPGNGGGSLVVEHIPGVGRIMNPQGHPQIGVGPDALTDHSGRSLGRQEKVDAKASSPLGNIDQRGDEARKLGGEVLT